MKLSADQKKELLDTLSTRFMDNMNRHPNRKWDEVVSRISRNDDRLKVLYEMERTGGEPDVVDLDERQDEIVFIDCSAESPSGRRSTCYDREGLESRKAHKPENNAVDMALEIGIEILSAEEYRHLQTLGKFDTKTSSWVRTPPEIRELGGALFCDRRYDTVFVYHNGAQSYYAARGFRGSFCV